MKKRLYWAAVGIALTCALLAPLASGQATGTFSLDVAIPMTSTPGSCPPGSPPDADFCAARTGSWAVRGLGQVSETYTFFVKEGDCDRIFETRVRLKVAGKGELQLAVERYGGECVSSSLNLSRGFTITGGSGVYAGASGGGAVDHRFSYTMSGSAGSDTWTGTLTVPGLEFDLTPPTITGATSKVVRVPRKAKRVRVKFSVAAADLVDGARPVTCKPKSTSLFKIGRTTVRCSATDTSENTQTAQFAVTVRRR